VRRSVKYGLYGAVLAGMVGGTVAWAGVDKTVTVRVDGQAAKIHTSAGTVRGALDDAGYQIGAHDIVAPAPDASVRDGSEVVLKRGRLLRMRVDGKERDIWVTTPTVADALAQLGYSTADFTSVSRAKRLPLTPTDIELRTPKTVTVVVDSATKRVESTDASVAQVLADLGIRLGAYDRLSVPGSTPLADNQKIVIQRVRKGRAVEQQPVPFPVTRTTDPALTVGQTTVVKAGRPGMVQATYAVVYIDGKLAGKTLVGRQVIAAPVPQVVKVGSKSAPPAVPAVPAAPVATAGSAQAIGKKMAAARGWGDDQYACLFQLWAHESGWRVNAANGSGAYGIPQALPGSKMGVYGADWQTNPATQIAWGLAYVAGHYGTPCGAWSNWQSNGWY